MPDLVVMPGEPELATMSPPGVLGFSSSAPRWRSAGSVDGRSAARDETDDEGEERCADHSVDQREAEPADVEGDELR
jgi:hypothetical protein